MIYRSAFYFVALAIVAGCAARPMPALTSAHPASPAAAEAPVPPSSTTLTPAAGLRADASGAGQAGMAMGHGAHGMSAATGPRAATSYTCPMHPDVHATQPGRCPKCGMTLVPRQPETGSATGGSHAH